MALSSRRCGQLLLSSEPPIVAAQLCQRRWDTSPYRKAHRLTWNNLHRPRWPSGGSLYWRATWGKQKPLPPSIVLATQATPREVQERGEAPESPRPLREKDQLLSSTLRESLGLSGPDAMVLLERSRVMVNGYIQKRDRWIRPLDYVTVNGKPLEDLCNIAFIAHKPKGVVLTEGDPLKRPTYHSLLPDPFLVVRPIGPVDRTSSGLLILTNRRSLLDALATDAGQWTTFDVQLKDPLTEEQLALLETALPWPFGERPVLTALDGGSEEPPMLPDPDALVGSHFATLPNSELAPQQLPSKKPRLYRVTLRRGEARFLRYAFSMVGVESAPSITCVSVGPLTIEEPYLMEPGSIRPLSEAEIQATQKAALESSADEGAYSEDEAAEMEERPFEAEMA